MEQSGASSPQRIPFCINWLRNRVHGGKKKCSQLHYLNGFSEGNSEPRALAMLSHDGLPLIIACQEVSPDSRSAVGRDRKSCRVA